MGPKGEGGRVKILRFGLVGVANTFVDYAILNVLVFVSGVVSPFGLVLCNFCSFLGANINSYVMNKRWTFEDRSQWSQREYLLFLLCSLGGLGINCGVIFVLSQHLFNPGVSFFVHFNLAKLVATIASMVWNFFSYKMFVFKRHETEGKTMVPACEGKPVPPVHG
jgi:putative flippase GtrA